MVKNMGGAGRMQLYYHTKHIFIVVIWCRTDGYNNIYFYGRKEMFYLTMHLNTFYLRLYGVGYMVKHHSDSEKGNLLPPHRLFPINSKGFFYMHHPRQDSTYHSLCYTSRGALAGLFL